MQVGEHTLLTLSSPMMPAPSKIGYGLSQHFGSALSSGRMLLGGSDTTYRALASKEITLKNDWADYMGCSSRI